MKKIAWILLIAMITGCTPTEPPIEPEPVIIEEVNPEDIEEQSEQLPRYTGIKGILTEISHIGETEESEIEILTIDLPDNSISNIVITNETITIDEYQIGDIIEVFYDTTIPMIKIYPQRYVAVVVTTPAPGSTSNVIVDTFDNTMLNSTGDLQLIVDNPEDYINKLLLVEYETITEIRPDKTHPISITVLD